MADNAPLIAEPAAPPSRVLTNLLLAALTLGTAIITGILLRKGLTTWLEAASFVTGAICVWLTNIWVSRRILFSPAKTMATALPN